MTRGCWLVALALCAAPAGAAAKKKAGAEKTMEWTGQYGGPREAGAEVALDAKSWADLWRRLGKDAPAPARPGFAAVAVYVGETPTGGYGVEFLAPAARGDDLLVRYRIKAPGGFATQAFAQPWKIRLFPRPKGKVVVEAAAP